MNNQNAETAINECQNEFTALAVLIPQTGVMSPLGRYLTHYSLIRACGTIEYAFKTIIADFHQGISPQLTNYLDNKVRSNSCNPSYQNIISMLGDFDNQWKTNFKSQVNALPDSQRILDSLNSLNVNRNSLAHGHGSTVSFNDIQTYFTDAIQIIQVLDNVVV